MGVQGMWTWGLKACGYGGSRHVGMGVQGMGVQGMGVQGMGFKAWGFMAWGFKAWGFTAWGFKAWGFMAWGFMACHDATQASGHSSQPPDPKPGISSALLCSMTAAVLTRRSPTQPACPHPYTHLLTRPASPPRSAPPSGGNSESMYLQKFTHSMLKRGYRTVVYNRRGHAGQSLLPKQGLGVGGWVWVWGGRDLHQDLFRVSMICAYFIWFTLCDFKLESPGRGMCGGNSLPGVCARLEWPQSGLPANVCLLLPSLSWHVGPTPHSACRPHAHTACVPHNTSHGMCATQHLTRQP